MQPIEPADVDVVDGTIEAAWPPPPIDIIDRTNTTPARHQHPKDHDDLQRAVNALISVLGREPFGQSATLSDELARLQVLADKLAIPGPQGEPGKDAPARFYGEGPPGVVLGARAADEYLDVLTGDLYVLN